MGAEVASQVNDARQRASQKPVGEVVQASTTEFVTQCHRLYEAPPLGSLVRCEGDTPVYGVVGDVSTQSIAAGRHPMAMGSEEETGEAVYRSNPQLSRLLSTEFRSVAVGFRSDGQLHRYAAPLPPAIHYAVYGCDRDEVLEFSSSLDFLPLLLSSPFGSADDATASFLRKVGQNYPEPEAFLVAAGKELAGLLGGQLQRLNGLLRRLSR